MDPRALFSVALLSVGIAIGCAKDDDENFGSDDTGDSGFEEHDSGATSASLLPVVSTTLFG